MIECPACSQASTSFSRFPTARASNRTSGSAGSAAVSTEKSSGRRCDGFTRISRQSQSVSVSTECPIPGEAIRAERLSALSASAFDDSASETEDAPARAGTVFSGTERDPAARPRRSRIVIPAKAKNSSAPATRRCTRSSTFLFRIHLPCLRLSSLMLLF